MTIVKLQHTGVIMTSTQSPEGIGVQNYTINNESEEVKAQSSNGILDEEW